MNMLVGRKDAFIPLLALLLLIQGCQKETTMSNTITGESLDTVSGAAWEKLAGKRIFFGHQSVGMNILDGVDVLLKEHPALRLNIVKYADPSMFDSPVFAHAEVGRNGDPKSKCEAFEQVLETGVGSRADIAFFKFCYMDFSNDAEVLQTFETYQAMIRRVEQKYPNLTLVHVTVPLTREETGLVASVKKWIKKVLGQKSGGSYANVGREKLNDLFRKTYGKNDPLFDLAAIESTSPSGEPVTFRHEGKMYPSLYPGYTSDGGHLNENGKRVLAQRLLLFLARIAEKSN
jgi:hypothetical protein